MFRWITLCNSIVCLFIMAKPFMKFIFLLNVTHHSVLNHSFHSSSSYAPITHPRVLYTRSPLSPVSYPALPHSHPMPLTGMLLVPLSPPKVGVLGISQHPLAGVPDDPTPGKRLTPVRGYEIRDRVGWVGDVAHHSGFNDLQFLQ